jgi:hypothetical protein
MIALRYDYSIVDLAKYRLFISVRGISIDGSLADTTYTLKTNNFGIGYNFYTDSIDNTKRYIKISWG